METKEQQINKVSDSLSESCVAYITKKYPEYCIPILDNLNTAVIQYKNLAQEIATYGMSDLPKSNLDEFIWDDIDRAKAHFKSAQKYMNVYQDADQT